MIFSHTSPASPKLGGRFGSLLLFLLFGGGGKREGVRADGRVSVLIESRGKGGGPFSEDKVVGSTGAGRVSAGRDFPPSKTSHKWVFTLICWAIWEREQWVLSALWRCPVHCPSSANSHTACVCVCVFLLCCSLKSPLLGARLQSEFCTKALVWSYEISCEKCSEIFPEFIEPLFCGSETNPANVPPNFPSNFPAKTKIKNKKKDSPTSFCRSAGRKSPLLEI